jgi:hypothetical protein
VTRVPYTVLLISEISNGGLRLTSLSGRARLNSWIGLHRLPKKLFGQVSNTLQIKCVEKLEGENNLLQLHLSVHPLKDPRTTSHSQTRILVGQIGSLHRYVTVVPEVKAEYGLVPVTFLFRSVLNQNAHACCYSQPFLQVSGIYLQYKKDERILITILAGNKIKKILGNLSLRLCLFLPQFHVKNRKSMDRISKWDSNVTAYHQSLIR